MGFFVQVAATSRFFCSALEAFQRRTGFDPPNHLHATLDQGLLKKASCHSLPSPFSGEGPDSHGRNLK